MFFHQGIKFNFFAHEKKKEFSSFQKDSKMFLLFLLTYFLSTVMSLVRSLGFLRRYVSTHFPNLSDKSPTKGYRC